MAAIPFPTLSSPGEKKQEGAGRIINAYVDPLGPGARAQGAIKRKPGLRQFAQTGLTGSRGQMPFGIYIFGAWQDTLVTIDGAGVVSTVGSLSGSGPVFFARNNRTPTPQAVVVTEFAAFLITPGSITQIVDPDLPQPNSVCFIDGYFIFTIADGRVFASGINDITIDALDFAQTNAKADTLIRGVAYEGTLFLFGSNSVEAWRNTANDVGFPFSRSFVIPRGLVGPQAVTGWDDAFGKGLFWVGDDNAVHVLSGVQAVRISTPDIDRDIEKTVDKSAIEMQSYVSSGHAFIAVSGPDWTWEFDPTTQLWSERKSYLQQRWRGTGNIISTFNQWFIGDKDSGDLLVIDPKIARENGSPLIWEVESAPVQGFPRSLAVPRAQFDFVNGTGLATGADPIETNPQLSVEWSDDGGVTWSTPIFRPIGGQGNYRQQITVNRTGRTGDDGRRWRLKVSDPVYIGLLGGDMTIRDRAR